MTNQTVHERRQAFNTGPAVHIARQLQHDGTLARNPEERSATFVDDSRHIEVIGTQEASAVQLALGRGLGRAQGRQLVLVLPDGSTNATVQRSAWLHPDAQPQVWPHDGTQLITETPDPPRTRDETVQAFSARLTNHDDVGAEYRDAATPLHLGAQTDGVAELVEWATTHRQLDPGHRQSYRAWHCQGQRVLLLQPTGAGIRITAGVDSKHDPGHTLELPAGSRLDADELDAMIEAAETGIAERLAGPRRAPDEHWLQAVLRRDPELVGIEQPALRELPAWRPADAPKEWGRGYLDLAGLDGHGHIRLVETKLSSASDELLGLQGLDYYIWAIAYRQAIADRLTAPPQAELRLHYVVGAAPDGTSKVHPAVAAQLFSLARDISWTVQHVHHWHTTDPTTDPAPHVDRLGERELP